MSPIPSFDSYAAKTGAIPAFDSYVPKGAEPQKQGFLSAFWEGVGGKTLMDLMGGAWRDPALAQKSIETLKGLASGLTNEGPRIMKELDAAGEAARKGDWGLVAHHVAGSAPLFGAGVQQAGKDWEDGNYSAAAGHTLAMFAPGLLHKAPGVAAALADTDAGAAVIGGAKGGAKALVETKPLTVKGVEFPVPVTAASAAAGGQAASMMGLPRSLGTVAGAAAPVIRGAVKGAKAALADRVQAAVTKARETALTTDAAKIPADVMAELTRDSGADAQPQATGSVPIAPLAKQSLPDLIRQYGAQGQELVEQPKPAGYEWWRDQPGTAAEKQALYERLFGGRSPDLISPAQGMVPRESAAQVAPAPPVAPPVAPAPPIAPPAAAPRIQPTMTRAEVDALQPPSPKPVPTNLAQQLFEEMQRSGTAPVEAPPEAAVEAPKDFAAGARTVKANKLAQALHDGGIPFEDARLMDRSNWDMLAKGIGVNVPSQASITETLGQLKRLSIQ